MSEQPFAPIIKVDYREVAGGVPAHLERCGCKVEMKELPIGDYCMSDIIAGERKTPEDLKNSVTGTKDGSREKGTLFRQIKELTDFYEISYLFIEGRLQDLFQWQGIPQNAPFGWLEAVQTMGCNIRFTVSPEGTAYTIKTIAVEAQAAPFQRWYSHHGWKKRLTHQERAERIIELLPGVGAVKAHGLYEEFGCVEAIMTAKTKELMRVEGIGREIAQGIRDAVTPVKEVPVFL